MQTSSGTGNPVLLVGSNSNPFSTYTTEMLKAEGVAFDTADLSALSTGTLAPYGVVVLGQISPSAVQVTKITTWVNNGGRLVALRPDKELHLEPASSARPSNSTARPTSTT